MVSRGFPFLTTSFSQNHVTVSNPTCYPYVFIPILIFLSPEFSSRPFKRLRFGDELPVTPPSTFRVEMVDSKKSGYCTSKCRSPCEQFSSGSPPAITRAETEAKLASSLEGFEKYIQYLATGRLDGFLDSIRREDKDIDHGVHLPLDPILLLHDLGKYPNQERINEMFTGDTMFVAST